MRNGWMMIPALLATGVMAGCTHQLEIKNLGAYSSRPHESLARPAAIGIRPGGNGYEAEKGILDGVAGAMPRNGAIPIYPFRADTGRQVDVIADIAVKAEYAGSAWNFLINFPGFLIWTPAWHGYVYKADYVVDITLTRSRDNGLIEQFRLPVHLNLRQAESDRTWIEVSWLDVGVTALISGVVFTQYDTDVTEPLQKAIQAPLGEYIADKIAARLNAAGANAISRAEPVPADGNQAAATLQAAAAGGIDYRIVDYRYDSASARGALAVDITGQGIEAREWVVKNIGRIASSKEHLLEAGNEKTVGGMYKILDESLKNGILTIEFEVLH